MDKLMVPEKVKYAVPYIGIPVIGAALAIIKWNYADLFIILLYEIFVVFGYIASVLDIKSKRIPNKLVLAMLAVWVIVMVLKLLVDTGAAVDMLIDSAIGFAVAGGLFLIVYLISRKGLGGGDVKFMAATGLFIGYSYILTSILFGAIIAGLTGIILILIKKINRKDTIPLTPFMYTGAMISLFIS